MSPYAAFNAAFPSPCCAAPWLAVNAGTVERDRTHTIARCSDCNKHWSLELTAEIVPQPTHKANPGRTKAATS